MENPDNTKQKSNINERRTRLGLLRKLKDTKDNDNIIDDSPSPFKNSKVSYDKKAQLKQNENKSMMQKLLESKRKKEQLKSKYEVSASSKDNNNNNLNIDNDNDNNTITTSNDDNDHANTKSTITTVSSSSNTPSTTLTHANNITNKLKQLLQSKSEDVEHSKDNSVNRSECNDNGNSANVNVCDNENEVSCAKNGEIKDQAQVTKVKMALFNKKNNKQSDVSSVNSVSEVSQQTHKVNEVKNILEMIKQKKNQKEQLQRSFEMEQQQQQKVTKEEDEQLQLHEDEVDGDKKDNDVIEHEDKVKQEEEQQQQVDTQKEEEEENEDERKRIKEEEEKKQREETRKLLLEELRKEVTKEITESVKKEFEEKVKRKQEEIEQKEKALLEREREAKEKLQQTQAQSLINEDNTNYYKQPKGVSHSAMNIPKYNNTQQQQQQQQQAYSNEHLNETTTSNTTNQVNAPTSTSMYYKKQNHVMIYNKKPNLRGRSADKTNNNNNNTPILNTNPNSLNNTHLYTNKQYLQQQQQQQHNYTNGMVNNNNYQQQYNTNKTSRYITTNQTPINIDTANTNNTSYLYYNNTNINSISYNYTNPFQYNDYNQMAPPSIMYNTANANTYYQQLQQQPYSFYRPSQPESLSMNFEDLLLFEQKLMDIIRDFIEDKPMTNECFEWWNYYFNCSLYKQLEKTFKNETSRQIVQESINYQLLSIIICYDVSSKPYIYDQVKLMIKPILLYNHHNLIIIYENILSKVSTESINNIWVTKLRNLIYTVKSSLHNEMNPDNVFINSPTPYDAFSVVDKIEYITLSIIGNIRILLKNYCDGETTSVLVNLFKTLKHKTYEEINDIFLSKILRVDNPNGSVLASVLIRENAYFSTVEAPYLKNPSVRPFTLVLDLDEAIIHFKINEHNETEGVLQVRPGIQEFLTTIGQFYEIVIFTAATQDYADLLIEELEENTFYFDYKLYRQHTIIIGNNFVKDLTRLGRPLDKVIIVDNMPQNFRLQKENGIHIRPFWGDDAQDTALIELQLILVNIAKEGGDVRKGLRKYKDEIMNKVTMNQTSSRC